MNDPKKLLKRLDEIAASVRATGKGRALLALGSAGLELDRLDQLSDLDFFVIVKDGSKSQFLEDLGWMEDVGPVAYVFMNTKDGHKLLFEDGIFCEYAVFELDELGQVPSPEGRVVWAESGLSAAQLRPKPKSPPALHYQTEEWCLGEALTNLYIGMARYRRGEKLSGMRFVQHYALDRVLDLLPFVVEAGPGRADEYDLVRRVEQRYPDFAPRLADFAPGYQGTPAAAGAILAFLDTHFKVNARMKDEIERLLAEGDE